MAGRPWLAATLLLAVMFAPVALAEKCTVATPYGDVEYECNAAASESTEAPPWWADERAQAIVGIVGLAASAGAGAYTFYRIKLRRRTLSDLVRAVESTFAESKAEPRAGVTTLVSLREEVRARHAKGRIEDAQFLELDRRVTTYLARLRRLDLDERFPALPPGLTRDLHVRVGDGLVSAADIAHLERHAGLMSISASQRAELFELLHAWAKDDGERGDSPTPKLA